MKKYATLFCLFVLAMASCKKNNDTPTNTTTNNFKTYGSMTDIFSLLAVQPKSITFDARKGASFYGNSGTRYVFKPNSFQNAYGDTTIGNVQVTVTELMKKGDMIFSGVLPVSDGQRLASAGEINVEVTKDGSELYLRDGYYMRAYIPRNGATDNSMSLFRGYADNNNTTNKVNWRSVAADGALIPYIDTSSKPIKTMSLTPTPRAYCNIEDSVRIIVDSCHHWNCDHFLKDTGLQTFTIKIVAGSDAATKSLGIIYAYALFSSENSLLTLSNQSGNVFNVNYLPKKPMHFIAFSLVNNRFYGGATEAITPATGQNYTITLTEVDPSDFKGQLNGLY